MTLITNTFRLNSAILAAAAATILLSTFYVPPPLLKNLFLVFFLFALSYIELMFPLSFIPFFPLSASLDVKYSISILLGITLEHLTCIFGLTRFKNKVLGGGAKMAEE